MNWIVCWKIKSDFKMYLAKLVLSVYDHIYMPYYTNHLLLILEIRVSYMMLMKIILDKVGSTFQKKEGKDKWDSFKIVFCVEWEIKKLPAFICRTRRRSSEKSFHIFIFLYFMCFLFPLRIIHTIPFHNASIFENCLKWKFAPNCL